MNRKQHMIELKQKGLSYQSIGLIYSISRARVHQIISGYGVLGQNRNGWYGQIKKLILQRDERKCLKCNSDKKLIVHHIDKNDTNNELTNLVTLCNACHLDLHRRKPWKLKLQQRKERQRKARNKQICRDRDTGYTFKTLALKYGLSLNMVWKITHGVK